MPHAVHKRTAFLKALQACPVIPSLRREEQLPALLASRARVVLVSSGSILNICEYVRELQRRNKAVLVHVDLIDGLGRDLAAVRFLKDRAGVDGIVTPHSQLITGGRKEGLLTVHRLFAHDSPSIETGIKVLQKSKPDFIEVLPGLAVLQALPSLRRHFNQPVIAAGLIKTPQEVEQVLDAGAVAVDTSTEALWDLEI